MKGDIKMKFGKQAAVLALSIAITATSHAPAWADSGAGSTVSAVSTYSLTGTVRAEVKGISINKLSEETRIGVIVRLYNDEVTEKRVPDYELRLRTSDGAVYTLKASSANDPSIQAKATADVTYAATISRSDNLSVSELAFVEVDDFVYPKKETALLTIPVTGRVWNAAVGDLTDDSQIIDWGTSFGIPASLSPLRYTPVSLSKVNDPKGASMLLTLLAENPSSMTETIPGFRMDGKAESQIFAGQRVEQGVLTLAAGEKKYIHYAIPVNNDTELSGLILMTTDVFVPAARQGQAVQPLSFDTGRLKVLTPAGGVTAGTSLADYAPRTPIAFDPLNRIIDSQTEVSLVDLQRHENDGDGYQTVVAKFKLTNLSDRTIPLPVFQAEISGGDGARYAGSRQNTAPANLMPRLSHVVSYAFALPKSEHSEQLGIHLLDAVTAAPYKTTIAAVKTGVTTTNDSDVMLFYPYSVKLHDWFLGAYTNAGQAMSYSYKLRMNLSLTSEDDVVTDQGFSKLKIELQDSLGRVLGSQTVPFTGPNKLIDGTQTINISNIRTEQVEYPLTVKLYETFETPDGEAKRLVKTLQQ